MAGQRGGMPQLTTHLSIDAPADAVWQVIGSGFAHIGDWATSIPASAAIPAVAVSSPPPAAAAASAPMPGRTCRTGTRLVPEIAETLTSYDEQNRTLTYQASGLPRFITAARSTWTVTPAGEAACRVTVTGHFGTRGVLGLLGCWAIFAQARLSARHLQSDLRHYVTHGTPSPRKQRQLSQSRPR
jgi:polyketide cyclase/dehydrase/lipid transport protein